MRNVINENVRAEQRVKRNTLVGGRPTCMPSNTHKHARTSTHKVLIPLTGLPTQGAGRRKRSSNRSRNILAALDVTRRRLIDSFVLRSHASVAYLNFSDSSLISSESERKREREKRCLSNFIKTRTIACFKAVIGTNHTI